MTRRRRFSPAAPIWQPCDLASVQAYIGARMAAADGDSAPAQLGDVTLMPHQRDAIVRLRDAIREFGGALLADGVGMGKTFVALAVGEQYDAVHVLAPAPLLPMWKDAIARACARRVTIHSLHACSYGPPAILTSAPESRQLVVIDEAHHLRTRTTARYRHVAAAVVTHDVLLLSATPLHNRPAELRALLALFSGDRDDLLSPALLSRVIVRRPLESSGTRPHVREHDPIPVPHDPGTLAALMALPAPLPAHDGAVAGALIRLGLLRAWCSSDAALADALRRRRLRGEALREALRAGRHPTNAELRSWLVGDHEVQLAFPELMASHVTERAPLLITLDRHLEALATLALHHARVACGDPVRASALRRIASQHAPVRVVALSQYAGTVRALYRALSDIAGVGALTGSYGEIASGRISRGEVLARFAPEAQGRPPPPPHGAITLLITTDLLAEGVNLQDAGVVVHLDLPWTDALRVQRVGRVARIGSRHIVVHEHRIGPPAGGDRVLRLADRLAEKAGHSARFVGAAASIASPAESASHVRSVLREWSLQDVRCNAEGIPVAVVHGAGLCAMTLLRRDGRDVIAACAENGIVSDTSVAVSACMHAIASAVDCSHWMASRPAERNIESAVAMVTGSVLAWAEALVIRADAGDGAQRVVAAHRRAYREIRSIVSSAPPARRGIASRLAESALAMLRAARGAGADHALDAWLADRSAMTGTQWLAAWSGIPALTKCAGRASDAVSDDASDAGPPARAALTILAIILVMPAAESTAD